MSEKIYTVEEIKKMVYGILKKFNVKKAILFYFYGLLEELVEKLGKEVDLFEIVEIQKNSKIFNDIEKEGITIYGK